MSDGLVDSIWYGQRRALLARALALGLTPAAWAYQASQAIRAGLKRAQRVNRPVISVGNLTVGGNGKTPLVLELVRLLEATGRKVAVVSRGYGRRTRGTRVAKTPGGRLPDADAVGDEPAMLAARSPMASVVVGEDRVDAARLAIQSCRPDVIVCDDAFQHLGLARDLDLVAVHARHGFGNRRLLPAGPLREPLSGLSRANLVVLTHLDEEPLADCTRRLGLPDGLEAIGCRLVPDGWVQGHELVPLASGGPRRVVAACGIAHPEGFFDSLRQFGVEVVDRIALGDHQRLTPKLLERLARLRERQRADAIALTEKDLARLGPHGGQLPLVALRLRVSWSDSGSLARIEQALERTCSLWNQENS